MKFRKFILDVKLLLNKYYRHEPSIEWDDEFLVTSYLATNDNRDELFQILYNTIQSEDGYKYTGKGIQIKAVDSYKELRLEDAYGALSSMGETLYAREEI